MFEDPMPEVEVTIAEVMCAAIARRLLERDHRVIFQGFASPLPTVAIRVARELSGGTESDIVHLSASGAVNGRPEPMPVSTEDQHLLEGATGHFTSPEVFDLAACGGVDVMFVGSPQIDRRGRMNASGVGSWDAPKIKFGGGGGSGSLLPLVDAAYAWRTEHSVRALPDRVDFVTASGNLRYLITPLCAFELIDDELQVIAIHPGTSRQELRDRTGWSVRFADPDHTKSPTSRESRLMDRVDSNRVRRSGFAVDQLDPIER